MHRETKATSIPRAVKLAVWQRDGECCIFCGAPVPMECANAHIIRRSQGGRGVEKNIVTACSDCHREMDSGRDAKALLNMAIKYIQTVYWDWKKEDVIYKKEDYNA